jgi:hypothetical protein
VCLLAQCSPIQPHLCVVCFSLSLLRQKKSDGEPVFQFWLISSAGSLSLGNLQVNTQNITLSLSHSLCARSSITNYGKRGVCRWGGPAAFDVTKVTTSETCVFLSVNLEVAKKCEGCLIVV